MAYTSSAVKFDTPESILFTLKNMLVAAGWSVRRSSDGLTYNATGDQITQMGSGAGGLANNSAWFCIQCPTVLSQKREFTFQRSTTTSANWRVKYSYGANFTGGTPGITQTPSATDEKIILGSGTDASPTYVPLFSTIVVKYSAITVGDASEGYTFYSSALDINRNLTHLFSFDMVTSASLSVGDVEPYVISFIAASSFAISIFATQAFSWFKKGLSGEGFVTTPAFSYTYSGFVTQPIIYGVQATNEKSSFFPMLYARETALAAPNGYKGFSHMIRTRTTTTNNYQTLTSVVKDDKIVCDIFVLPWGGIQNPF